MTDAYIWIGIAFCITQSATFSGLNLAFFSVSRLRLEIESANGNEKARRVLAFRQNSNFLLATILWGNVGINVLLTLLSNSVLLGAASFFFSTFLITIMGEILPQAYFSRNALKMASLLAPVLRFYQRLLYPVGKPTAICLDMWLGEEDIRYMREKDLRQLIHRHIDASESEVDVVEGIGALNFLAIDDVRVIDEGEPLAPGSILPLPFVDGRPDFFSHIKEDEFIDLVGKSHRRWVIITDAENTPCLALDTHTYLRELGQSEGAAVDPANYCHRPVVVTDPSTRLGSVIARFKSTEAAESDSAFPHRIVVYWGEEQRIITAGDILGRLFKGIGMYSSLSASTS